MVDHWGGGGMFKGLFYDFESEEQFVALVEKVRGKCEADGECLIWPGGFTPKGQPIHQQDGSTFQPRRLVFQATNPTFELPECPFKVVNSCRNDKCIAHVKIVTKVNWDVDKIVERLHAGCTRCPVDGCLLWKGCTNVGGYGLMNVDRQSRLVHNLALLIHDGISTPPTGENGKALMVRHVCKNRRCCEVTHLEWGTALQNGGDRIRDGTNCAGEKSALAKMTEETAMAIKMSWRPRNHPEYLTQAQRGVKFGVRECVVNNIDCGGSWNHLPSPANKPMIVKAEKKRTTPEDVTEDVVRTLIARIEKKLTVTPGVSKNPSLNTPCKIFTGASLHGYGVIKYKGLTLRPHILVCENNMKQRTPEGLVTRHLCSVKKCCAPDHLTFGSRTENWVDAVAHGDIKKKFTIDDIKRLRDIPLADTDAIQREADEFKVRFDYIQGIITKRIWGVIE
jgi:hypothetical protein